MVFYRGDDRGPGDMKLRTVGFDAKPPAVTMDGSLARTFLANLFRTQTSVDIGFGWRAETPGNLVATAMTQEGAFQGKNYFYKIVIPDQELTLQVINMRGVRQVCFPVNLALTKGGYFLLYNNPRYEAASMIAFCHGCVHTKEVTFITKIPSRYIVGYRNGANTTKENVPFAPFVGPHRPRLPEL
jgi:hypothetical protein